MFKSVLLIAIIILQVAPSFLVEDFVVDAAFELIQLCNLLTLVVFSLYTCCDLCKIRPYRNVLITTAIIVSLVYFTSYMREFGGIETNYIGISHG